MSSLQIAVPYRHLPLRLVAPLVAAAFALGAITGFGLPRIVDGVSHATGGVGAVIESQTVIVAHEPNMSDAAYQAFHRRASAVVAHEPNMSDAAYQAFHRRASAP